MHLNNTSLIFSILALYTQGLIPEIGEIKAFGMATIFY